MPAFLVSEDEQESLYGLVAAAQVLYYWLRARMDFRTGRVGAVHHISWQAAREAIYIEPRRGVKTEYLHKEAVRRLARQLEARGLVRFQSSIANAQLIFLLPKATTLSFAQKKADTKPTGSSDREADRGLQRGKQAKADREADRGKTAKADTHRGSVPSTTTTLDLSTVGDAGETLQWPSSATPEEKATWKTLIDRAGLNGNAQLILDEFSGALLKNAIQKRTGYLMKLIARKTEGSFVPDLAYQVQDARERASKVKARISQASETYQTSPAAMATGRAVLDNIRKRRKDGRAERETTAPSHA